MISALLFMLADVYAGVILVLLMLQKNQPWFIEVGLFIAWAIVMTHSVVKSKYLQKPIVPDHRDMPVGWLREGHEKRGGVNPPPTTEKPANPPPGWSGAPRGGYSGNTRSP